MVQNQQIGRDLTKSKASKTHVLILTSQEMTWEQREWSSKNMPGGILRIADL